MGLNHNQWEKSEPIKSTNGANTNLQSLIDKQIFVSVINRPLGVVILLIREDLEAKVKKFYAWKFT